MLIDCFNFNVDTFTVPKFFNFVLKFFFLLDRILLLNQIYPSQMHQSTFSLQEDSNLISKMSSVTRPFSFFCCQGWYPFHIKDNGHCRVTNLDDLGGDLKYHNTTFQSRDYFPLFLRALPNYYFQSAQCEWCMFEI